MKIILPYTGNPLDRGELERRDETWISSASRNSNSRFVPFNNLNVLLNPNPSPKLGWFLNSEIRKLTPEIDPLFLGMTDNVAHFAVDFSNETTAISYVENDLGWYFEDCRAAGAILSPTETGIIAQARAQLYWHQNHGFCSVCGNLTVKKRGGQVRECITCHVQHFPRTDPVVITVVSDTSSDRCLLGQSRGRLSRMNMYSTIAGFVDQGESIEEAVAREVMEEAGIKLKRVRYHSSQPWPFPYSLMIGCLSEAATNTIKIDTEEMADVCWFEREEVLRALDGKSKVLTVPNSIAIAHHLIKAWALSL